MDLSSLLFSDFFEGRLTDDEDIKKVCNTSNLGQQNSDQDYYVPYSRQPWLKYIFITLIAVIYIIPLIYVWKSRKVAVTRARSPLTTLICITLIMLDSIFNTCIFSIDLNSSHYDESESNILMRKKKFTCLLGVWVTTILYLPILLTMYLRIYRIKSVFEVY